MCSTLSRGAVLAAAVSVLAEAHPAPRLLSQTPQQQPQPSQPPQRARGDRGMDFASQGVQVGQYLDSVLAVHTLDGKAAPLAPMWKDRPALIVTASLTCPVARRQCPMLKPIAEQLGERINLVILYTVEAHPTGEASPYRPNAGEWVTPQNQREGVLHAQPKTLEDRLALARDMHERLGGLGTMLVDGMDDSAWKALGGGPNLAVLVGSDGTVEAKHGWLDAQRMRAEVDGLLQREVQRQARAQEIGQAVAPQMQAFIEAICSGDRARIESFHADGARIWFEQKTGPGEAIAESHWRAWDAELRAAHAIERADIALAPSAPGAPAMKPAPINAVIVVSRETNDFSRLIEFAGWRATTTYWFGADGKVIEKLYQPMEVSPSMRERFAPALEWARQHQPGELAAVYPNDQFAPSAESARRWRDLLIEWRKATGRPALDLAE